MIPEELLKPRYKVIADYPLSHMYFDIGDILIYDNQFVERVIGGKDASMALDTVNKYPHIFKHLSWWEERKPQDMPMFLKDGDRVWKLTGWGTDVFGHPFPINEVDREGETSRSCDISWHFRKSAMLPATLEEYTTYINSLKTTE